MRKAILLGLRVPLVYNCGGYEPVEVVRLLDGILDIYLPDFKYAVGTWRGSSPAELQIIPTRRWRPLKK